MLDTWYIPRVPWSSAIWDPPVIFRIYSGLVPATKPVCSSYWTTLQLEMFDLLDQGANAGEHMVTPQWPCGHDNPKKSTTHPTPCACICINITTESRWSEAQPLANTTTRCARVTTKTVYHDNHQEKERTDRENKRKILMLGLRSAQGPAPAL